MTTDKPIRIAQIMGKLWAGGVESVVFNYYKFIDKSKFQFDFYYDEDSTVEPSKELISMGARFIKIPAYQNTAKYIRTLERYFRENNYLIVHSHINTLGVIPLYVAKRCNVPIRIQHNHSVPGGHEFKRNFLKNILKLFSKTYSTHYFACSEKAGRWMFGDKTFDNDGVFIMRNAIDFSKYTNVSSEESEKLLAKLGLNDKYVVGHVGRFTFAKNHSFLIDIFKKILEKKESARLLLVGDGELHNEISEKIQRLGISDKVIMVGKVKNPEKYYAIMDVLILPSIFEGLSMTTIEAQVAGKNIFVSNAIPKEAKISNLCHFVSDDYKSSEWVQYIFNHITQTPRYTVLREEYNIENAVTILEAKYNKLLSIVE